MKMSDVLEATPAAPAAPAAALEATPAAAPVAPAPATDTPSTLYKFEIDDYDNEIAVELNNVPAPLRLRLLKTATRAYITNRISTAAAKTKKENAKFDQYDAAMKNDPLQTLVPKPEGDRAATDYAGIVDGAIKALYSGEIGRRGDGEGKKKVLRDPLITQITRAVVADVYEKGRAADLKYKYPTAQKEVGSDGLAYLKGKIAEKVAAGGDAAALNQYLETKYIKPARIMLGLDVPKSLKDAGGIL
jgi:hypothetical protein